MDGLRTNDSSNNSSDSTLKVRDTADHFSIIKIVITSMSFLRVEKQKKGHSSYQENKVLAYLRHALNLVLKYQCEVLCNESGALENILYLELNIIVIFAVFNLKKIVNS